MSNREKLHSEIIEPCPYATFFPEENQGVSFIVKKNDLYFDYIDSTTGKPWRCIRTRFPIRKGE